MGTIDRAEADVLTSRALTNLRGVFILILVAFHSSLAYLSSAPAAAPAFEQPPYSWLAFPVVDERRFFGFDLYCAWEDVHVMAMMFFLSGVFVPGSLRRKGPARFAAERTLRLGAPFAFGVLALAPLALYPVFHRTNPTAGVADYLAAYGDLPFLPNGPQWFLWLLLAFSLTAAAAQAVDRRALARLAGLAAGARNRAWPLLLALFVAATLAYLPLAMLFGPFDWYIHGPLSFQESRPLLFGVYFFAGAAVGGARLGEGLLAPDGALARSWRGLALLSPALLFLWMGTMGATLNFPSFAPLAMSACSALAYAAASVAGVACLLAATLRFCTQRIRWLTPLARNSLGVYTLHYPAMVWSQSALVGANLPALVKACLVFAFTLGTSLAMSAVLRRTPLFRVLVGEAPDPSPRARPGAASAPAPVPRA